MKRKNSKANPQAQKAVRCSALLGERVISQNLTAAEAVETLNRSISSRPEISPVLVFDDSFSTHVFSRFLLAGRREATRKRPILALRCLRAEKLNSITRFLRIVLGLGRPYLCWISANARTERRGRSSAPALATDVARSHSLQ